MQTNELSRRAFAGIMAGAALSAAGDGWIELFNGRNLEGWRPSENKDSWISRAWHSVAPF